MATAPVSHSDSHDHGHHAPGFVEKYLWSTDHKMIAMQYLFTGMAMGLIGGFFAYAFRMQIAFPGIDVPGFGVVSRTSTTTSSPITARS